MLVSDIVVEELPAWLRENEFLYSSCAAGAISQQEYVQGLREARLTDIEFRGRLVYDRSMLVGLVQSELAATDTSLGRFVESMGQDKITEMLQQIEGKIASISIYARSMPARRPANRIDREILWCTYCGGMNCCDRPSFKSS